MLVVISAAVVNQTTQTAAASQSCSRSSEKMDWELACHAEAISISEVFKYPLSETRRSCVIQPYSWR